MSKSKNEKKKPIIIYHIIHSSVLSTSSLPENEYKYFYLRPDQGLFCKEYNMNDREISEQD